MATYGTGSERFVQSLGSSRPVHTDFELKLTEETYFSLTASLPGTTGGLTDMVTDLKEGRTRRDRKRTQEETASYLLELRGSAAADAAVAAARAGGTAAGRGSRRAVGIRAETSATMGRLTTVTMTVHRTETGTLRADGRLCRRCPFWNEEEIGAGGGGGRGVMSELVQLHLMSSSSSTTSNWVTSCYWETQHRVKCRWRRWSDEFWRNIDGKGHWLRCFQMWLQEKDARKSSAEL